MACGVTIERYLKLLTTEGPDILKRLPGVTEGGTRETRGCVTG
jgi:hypothetical protein